MKSVRQIVITAGPTREHLDPVRFLSNPSTGRMGFAVARAAAARGWDVTLVAGPVTLPTPHGVRRVDVTSAREMLAAVRAALPADAFVATAAVADWRPARVASKKLKKAEMAATLKLVRNPDVLKTVSAEIDAAARAGRPGGRCVRVGFAAEPGDPTAEAARKCRAKGLDFIVANDVTQKGCGFGTATNRVTILRRDGSARPLPLLAKTTVARRILDEIERILEEGSSR